MSMSAGSASAASSEINVTPLIDVLLVLLILFMVLVPAMPQGLVTALPQPGGSAAVHPRPRAIIVTILLDDHGRAAYRLGEESLPKSELSTKLASIYSTRAPEERELFVQDDPRLEYGEVAKVIDLAHQAGVDRVGILTPRFLAGR